MQVGFKALADTNLVHDTAPHLAELHNGRKVCEVVTVMARHG